MIDPNEVTTARVGELTPAPFELTDNIPHEIGDTLFRGTVQQLGDVIGDYLGAVSGLSFNNTVVPDGGTLPETETKEWLFVGKGTFHNVGGQPDITTTEVLNILSSNGSYWSLAVEIPVDVELAGITQNIRSGYTATTPSEDAVYKRIAEIIGMIPQDTDDISNASNVDGANITEALNNLENLIPTTEGFILKNTISEIRALSGTLPSNNFYTTDLGQEGNWYYDASDTTSADNTGTILVTVDGKRIKRVVEGSEIYLDWFYTNKPIDVFYTGSSTASSDVFNITGANLNADYIGSNFAIRGANTTGTILTGTVLQVLSPTQFQGSVSAVNTVSSANIIIGGDNVSTALQTATNYLLNNGGGKIKLADRPYWINTTVTIEPSKQGIPFEIEGVTEKSMQDGFGGATKGSSFVRTTAGNFLNVNLNASGVGVLTAPLGFTAFTCRNINFINWGDASQKALNVFRTRGIYENLSSHRMDYLINQESVDASSNPSYNDNSIYKNLAVHYSKFGGLKLYKNDASRLETYIFESPDATAKFGMEVINSPAFSIDNVIHGSKATSTTISGGALIRMEQCFGASISNVHAEDCQLESLFNIENCGAISVSNIFTYLTNQTAFTLSFIKGLNISNWYSYETRPGGTYDIDFGTNSGNTDIKWDNIQLFDTSGIPGATRRDIVLTNTANRGLTYLATPIEYVDDMNLINGYKQFRSKSGCANLPGGLSFFSGTQYLISDNNNYRVQSGMGGDFIYTRYMNNGVWGNWNKVLNATDLNNTPLTGVPTAPTAAANTNTTQVATTANVVATVNNRISGTSNVVPKFTGTNTVGNSTIQDNGTGIGLGGSVNASAKIRSTTDTALQYGVLMDTNLGQTSSTAMFLTPSFTSAVLTRGVIYKGAMSTAVASFTLPELRAFSAEMGTIGAGSTVTDLVGFYAANLAGGTNTYGFRSILTAGTNKWNLYFDGTAINHLNGALLIGTTTNNGVDKLQVTGTASATVDASLSNQLVRYGQLTGLVSSASYSPSVTASTNVTSATLSTASYTKVGNIVTGSIAINLQATAISLLSEITFTAPVNRAGVVPNYYMGNGTYATDIIYSAGNAFFSSFGTSTITIRFNSGASVASTGTCVFSFQYDVTK